MDDEGTLADRTTSGVAWTIAQKWAVRATGFVTIAVLARLLDPADFGVVAAASTVTPLLYLLSDLGFSAYVVQAEKVDRTTLSTAFWFSVVAGLALTAALIVVAPLLALVFSAPRLDSILPVLSIAVLAVAVASVPVALLRRRMEFRRLALQSAVAAVVAQGVAVGAAVAGLGVWALVLQVVTSQLIVSALACWSAGWCPALVFSPRELARMTTFGLNVVGFEFVELLRVWGETAIVSATLGVSGLGYLNIAQRLIQVSQDLTVAAVTPVTTVAFARVRSSAERLRNAYVRVLEATFALMTPFVVMLATTAPVALPLVFGPGWSASVLPARVYAVASLMVVGAIVDKAFFTGVGRPGRWLAYAVLVDALTVAVTAVVVHGGLEAVALGFVGVAFVALVARVTLVAVVLDAPWRSIASPFLRVLVVAAGSSLVAIVVQGLATGLPPVADLAVVGAASSVAYLVLVRWQLPRTYALLDGLLHRLLAAWRRMPSPHVGVPSDAASMTEGEVVR